MKDRIFLDTNILVYSYSSTEPIKQIAARNLIIKNSAFISTQVLQELTNTITRKFKFSYDEAINVINECSHNNIVHNNTTSTILKACKVASRYGFTF
jgi:predicted nucleic acid-binding protein